MKKTVILALLLATGAAQAQSRLDSVLSSKVLKVCTTGDYKPYSFLRPDGQYEGLDISMAKALAASLGAKVEWVATSWKTLMPDFLAKQCDIALGGVSVTLKRQQTAWFAQPLGVD
ncbi:MAG: transporter substrate-binding domain-containing protein, partial [Pantoea sp.]|nr:transporter substrate-binding domain-containing protein [Pantoea sp.]